MIANQDTERFMAKVQRPTDDGCWTWTAGLSPDGYGKFWLDGKTLRAHRVSYEMFVAGIPEGLVIDHLCRNILCVNPTHLEPVTSAENIMRGVGVAPRNAAKTHCIRGHALTGGNVRLTKTGGERVCRACCVIHSRRDDLPARDCAVCGRSFTPLQKPSARLCSRACIGASKRKAS